MNSDSSTSIQCSQPGPSSILAVLDDKNCTIDSLQTQLENQKLQLQHYLQENFPQELREKYSKKCLVDKVDTNMAVNMAVSSFCKDKGVRSKLTELYDNMHKIEEKMQVLINLQERVLQVVLGKMMRLQLEGVQSMRSAIVKKTPGQLSLFYGMFQVNSQLRRELNTFRVCSDRLIAIEEERNNLAEELSTFPPEERSERKTIIVLKDEKLRLQQEVLSLQEQYQQAQLRQSTTGCASAASSQSDETLDTFTLANINQMMDAVNYEAAELLKSSVRQKEEFLAEKAVLKKDIRNLKSQVHFLENEAKKKEDINGKFDKLQDLCVASVEENVTLRSKYQKRLKCEAEKWKQKIEHIKKQRDLLEKKLEYINKKGKENNEFDNSILEEMRKLAEERDYWKNKAAELEYVQEAYKQLIDQNDMLQDIGEAKGNNLVDLKESHENLKTQIKNKSETILALNKQLKNLLFIVYLLRNSPQDSLGVFSPGLENVGGNQMYLQNTIDTEEMGNSRLIEEAENNNQNEDNLNINLDIEENDWKKRAMKLRLLEYLAEFNDQEKVRRAVTSHNLMAACVEERWSLTKFQLSQDENHYPKNVTQKSYSQKPHHQEELDDQRTIDSKQILELENTFVKGQKKKILDNKQRLSLYKEESMIHQKNLEKIMKENSDAIFKEGSSKTYRNEDGVVLKLDRSMGDINEAEELERITETLRTLNGNVGKYSDDRHPGPRSGDLEETSRRNELNTNSSSNILERVTSNSIFKKMAANHKIFQSSDPKTGQNITQIAYVSMTKSGSKFFSSSNVKMYSSANISEDTVAQDHESLRKLFPLSKKTIKSAPSMEGFKKLIAEKKCDFKNVTPNTREVKSMPYKFEASSLPSVTSEDSNCFNCYKEKESKHFNSETTTTLGSSLSDVVKSQVNEPGIRESELMKDCSCETLANMYRGKRLQNIAINTKVTQDCGNTAKVPKTTETYKPIDMDTQTHVPKSSKCCTTSRVQLTLPMYSKFCGPSKINIGLSTEQLGTGAPKETPSDANNQTLENTNHNNSAQPSPQKKATSSILSSLAYLVTGRRSSEGKNQTDDSINQPHETRNQPHENRNQPHDSKHQSNEDKHESNVRKHQSYEGKHQSYDRKHQFYGGQHQSYEGKEESYEGKDESFGGNLYTSDGENQSLEDKTAFSFGNPVRIGRNKTYIGKNQSSLDRNPSPMGQNQTYVGRNESSLDRNPSPMGKNQTYIGRNQSSLDKNPCLMSKNQTYIGKNQSSVDRSPSNVSRNQYSVDTTSPGIQSSSDTYPESSLFGFESLDSNVEDYVPKITKSPLAMRQKDSFEKHRFKQQRAQEYSRRANREIAEDIQRPEKAGKVGKDLYYDDSRDNPDSSGSVQADLDTIFNNTNYPKRLMELSDADLLEKLESMSTQINQSFTEQGCEGETVIGTIKHVLDTLFGNNSVYAKP